MLDFKSRIGYKIFIANTIIVLFGLLLFGFWYFLDGTVVNKPLEFNMDINNMITEKTTYKPGEPVKVYTSFCKQRDVVGVSSWSLVDTIVRFYPEKRASAPIGCYGINSPVLFQAVVLPPDLFDGVYHLEGTSNIKVNPLRTITYTFKTQSFNIEN